MNPLKGRLLFPNHILHGLNALQHLRAMHILGACTDDVIYSTCEDIAREVGAPLDSLYRSLGALVHAGVVESTKSLGYQITPQSLHKYRVLDVVRALGKDVPDQGNERASDRLNNAVADCLDVILEEFFK